MDAHRRLRNQHIFNDAIANIMWWRYKDGSASGGASKYTWKKWSVQQPVEPENEEQCAQTAIAPGQQAPVSDRPQTAMPSLGAIDVSCVAPDSNRRAASAREPNRPHWKTALAPQTSIGPGQQSPAAQPQAHDDRPNLARMPDAWAETSSIGEARNQRPNDPRPPSPSTPQ